MIWFLYGFVTPRGLSAAIAVLDCQEGNALHSISTSGRLEHCNVARSREKVLDLAHLQNFCWP